jgi:hypothetical protein
MTDIASEPFDAAQMIPGFRAPELPSARPERAILDAAEHNTRHWTSTVAGPLTPGSDVHLRETCRMFRDTFNPYRPSVLEWPALAPEALERIVSLPIWDIAVQTEGKARLRMAAYAATLDDPQIRDAIALNAWEEHRHKAVLSRMVAAYGIALASESPYAWPKNPEWAYLVTGYSECVDSFFAFGLFEVARRSGLFPPAPIDTFEPVMQEECRHILLFSNWLGWHRARLPWYRRIGFELKVAAVWTYLGWERVGLARTMDAEGNEHRHDNNFTMNGAQSVSAAEIGMADLMRLCVEENDRRFAGYDSRLLQPRTMPALVRFALRVTSRFARKRSDGA